jgi:hypothetical protein
VKQKFKERVPNVSIFLANATAKGQKILQFFEKCFKGEIETVLEVNCFRNPKIYNLTRPSQANLILNPRPTSHSGGLLLKEKDF